MTCRGEVVSWLARVALPVYMDTAQVEYPLSQREFMLLFLGYFYRGILLLPAVASSVGTSTVLVVPNSFVFSLLFWQLKEENI